MTYNITTADNTANNYDIGIADTTGAIKARTGTLAGTTFSAATGARLQNWSGGAVTLQPGKYYVALTTSCTTSCAVLSGDGSAAAVTFLNGSTAAVTAGGALTSFTPPADLWSWAGTVPAIVVR